jgi:DNA-binding response OmpR family regulator
MTKGVPLTALVVEDDESIRALVARLVERAGFQVDTASDGSSAIRNLQEKRYDCVILDLMMAPVSGYEVLEYLDRNDPPTMRRTIVVSAAGEEAIQRVRDMGVFAAIPKPFDIPHLEHVLSECLAARRDETLRFKRESLSFDDSHTRRS